MRRGGIPIDMASLFCVIPNPSMKFLHQNLSRVDGLDQIALSVSRRARHCL